MPSLSTARPGTTVTIDRPRVIRFNWSAACRFEEKYGKSIPSAMQADQIGARLITHLAWCGLLHEEPGLTPRDVEARLEKYLRDDGDIQDLATALVKALAESGVLGKPKKRGEDEDEPAGNAEGVSQE